jgi:phosphohistidine phosphatase
MGFTLGGVTVALVSEPKTIVIMRHAKAEQSGPTDFERRLAPRGQVAAVDAGRWLREQGIAPDLALVSAAHRTRETWEHLAASAAYGAVDVVLDEAWYGVGPEAALDLIRRVPETATTVLVVGHNPTMASVATLLDDGEGQLEASTSMVLDFPTSAIAVFSFPGAWVDLAEASALLTGYHVPRA